MVSFFLAFSTVLSHFLSRKTVQNTTSLLEYLFWSPFYHWGRSIISSYHRSEADLNSEANQLSLEDPVESVGVLASSSRFCITPPSVDVPASTRWFSGMAAATSRNSRKLPELPGTPRLGTDSLGGLDGLEMGGLETAAAAPPAEPRLLLRLVVVVAALPMLLCLGMAPPCCCACCSLSLSLLALMLPVREPAPSETDVC